MARTRTPEEIEAKIEAARSGDVGEAASLLRLITSILEENLLLPEPLRLYLIAAFREITKDDTPGGIYLPPHPPFTTLPELREIIQYFEETRDANAALNLTRPRGRKHTARRKVMESSVLAMEVKVERDRGQSLEQAIGAVADRMKVSETKVSRAWHRMKGLLYPDGGSK